MRRARVVAPALALCGLHVWCTVSSSASSAEEIEAQIVALYQQHNPAKLDAVPGLMAKYAGVEDELLATIREKYGDDLQGQSTAAQGGKGRSAKSRRGRRKAAVGQAKEPPPFAGGRRDGEQVCSGLNRSLDVWMSDEVKRVWEPGTQQALGLFEVVERKRVMLLPESSWIPAESCSDWFPIGAASHLPINTYKCDYPRPVGDQMLANFWAQYEVQLRAAFGVVSCEHRSKANRGGKAKHYATVGNREMEPDDLHADGCPTDPHLVGDPLWAADCVSDSGSCKIHLTVLSYPHNTWDVSWGGHTEWAARKCGDPEDMNREVGQVTPAALRVAPLGDRTVVFSGGLLHRATHPEPHAGVAQHGQRAGLRFSMVMQLVCRTHAHQL